MISAWGTKQLLFTSLESAESRTRRKVTVALEFVEYESVAGVVQDRKGAAEKTKKVDVSAAQNRMQVVSDQQRRGLGSMEARYGKL
jgi:hypothetical protein